MVCGGCKQIIPQSFLRSKGVGGRVGGRSLLVNNADEEELMMRILVLAVVFLGMVAPPEAQQIRSALEQAFVLEARLLDNENARFVEAREREVDAVDHLAQLGEQLDEAMADTSIGVAELRRMELELGEARAVAEELLGLTLVTEQTGPEGRKVEQVYVEEAVDAQRVLYLAVLVDREVGKIALLGAEEGGEDIEDRPPGTIRSSSRCMSRSTAAPSLRPIRPSPRS